MLAAAGYSMNLMLSLAGLEAFQAQTGRQKMYEDITYILHWNYQRLDLKNERARRDMEKHHNDKHDKHDDKHDH